MTDDLIIHLEENYRLDADKFYIDEPHQFLEQIKVSVLSC